MSAYCHEEAKSNDINTLKLNTIEFSNNLHLINCQNLLSYTKSCILIPSYYKLLPEVCQASLLLHCKLGTDQSRAHLLSTDTINWSIKQVIKETRVHIPTNWQSLYTEVYSIDVALVDLHNILSFCYTVYRVCTVYLFQSIPAVIGPLVSSVPYKVL